MNDTEQESSWQSHISLDEVEETLLYSYLTESSDFQPNYL